MIAFTGQTAGSTFIVTSHVQFLSLIFGSFWLFIVIAEEMANELATFNAIIGTSKRNRSELMKRFCHIIQTYTDAQQ